MSWDKGGERSLIKYYQGQNGFDLWISIEIITKKSEQDNEKQNKFYKPFPPHPSLLPKLYLLPSSDAGRQGMESTVSSSHVSQFITSVQEKESLPHSSMESLPQETILH